MNFNNQNYIPYGTTLGTAVPNQTPQPKYTNPLTQEERRELQKHAPQFSTQIDRKDMLRSFCTHRTEADTALIQNPDGSFTCTICGDTVFLDPYTPEEVQEICDKYKNLMNNIKVKFYDIPEDVVKDVCQIIPYVEITPKLYQLAQNNYDRYGANYGDAAAVTGNPTYSAWNSFNQLYGAGFYMQPAAQYAYGGQPTMSPQFGASTMNMQQAQMVAGGNPLYAAPAPQPVPAPAPMPAPQAQPTAEPQQAQVRATVQL